MGMTVGHSQTCHSVCPLKMKGEMRVKLPFVERTHLRLEGCSRNMEFGVIKNTQIEFFGFKIEYA